MDNNHTTYKDHPIYQRLMASGPKRILSLDGGAIQGVLTLEYLEVIERMLIDRYDDDNFVLSDYFDLVGGTSTGAIIATFIALGKPVKEIKKYYSEQSGNHLVKRLSDHQDFNNLTLGSNKFKTGLAIFIKRVNSKSIFVFHNHPLDKNYELIKGNHLFDLLNSTASKATNLYPSEIKFTDIESVGFKDDNPSVFINPSLLLFLMTTHEDYGYKWRKSKDHLLIISIGSEYHISASMSLDYYNYHVSINKNKLAKSNIHLTDKRIKSLSKIENSENAKSLYKIGKAEAIIKVSTSHFPTTFDFGLGKSKSPPISQEEVRKIFTPIMADSGRIYKKFKKVFAKKADSIVEITTTTSDGIETQNTAKKGDFIVKNQTESQEQYVVHNDKFVKRYEVIRKMPDGVWTEYSPKGEVTGIQLTENLLNTLNLDKHFYIMASWGQAQYIGIGDFIVNPIDEDGFYRIGLKEFKETYTLKKS